jgi:predicted dehydrogenase
MAQALGVAVVGFGWMGRVHTQAYLRVPHHFPQLGVRPELVAVADEVPGRAEEAAARYGFATASRDWREVVADPRVRAVSITAPNFLHREIGTAMAGAGKHIWIEKPVGLTPPTRGPWPGRRPPPGCRGRWASTTATRRPSPPPAS